MGIALLWVAARQDRDGAWSFCRDRSGAWTDKVTEAVVFDRMADALEVGEAMPWPLAMQVAFAQGEG